MFGQKNYFKCNSLSSKKNVKVSFESLEQKMYHLSEADSFHKLGCFSSVQFSRSVVSNSYDPRSPL